MDQRASNIRHQTYQVNRISLETYNNGEELVYY